MMTAAVTGQRSQLQTNTYSLAMPSRSASQNPAPPPAASSATATSSSTAPPIVMPERQRLGLPERARFLDVVGQVQRLAQGIDAARRRIQRHQQADGQQARPWLGDQVAQVFVDERHRLRRQDRRGRAPATCPPTCGRTGCTRSASSGRTGTGTARTRSSSPAPRRCRRRRGFRTPGTDACTAP